MKTKLKIDSKFELEQTVYFAIHRSGGWIMYKGKILLISPTKIRAESGNSLETNELVIELTNGNIVKRYEDNVCGDRNELHKSLKEISSDPIKWSF